MWCEMDKIEKILPTIIIVINLLSSIPYFINLDWRHGVYWLAAAILTFTVTY